MGLFDFLGGKKKREEEEALLLEQQERERKEQEKAELKELHMELGWPVPSKINPVRVAGKEDTILGDPLTEDRKEEIGEMLYEDEISVDSLRFLSLQELLFLITAQELFQKKAALPGFEANHRKIYNEILGRVRDAKMLYVLYDQLTGYPFIDHGYINIYLDQDHAEAAVKVFETQYRRLAARPCKADNEAQSAKDRRSYFDYLYYLGIENFIVDNGYYRAHFRRNEIVAAPGDWGGTTDNSPKNPALVFSILDFLGEARWPVKYEKRNEILAIKEMCMAQAAQAATYIVPMVHEGPVDIMEDGRFKFTKDTKIRFPEIKSKDDKHFLPVFTDGMEFTKMFANSEFKGAVFTFPDILKFVGEKDGIIINPGGQKIMIPRDRMLALQMAAQQAAISKQAGKKPAKKKLTETEAAIQSAMKGKGIAAKADAGDKDSFVELTEDSSMTDIPADNDSDIELMEGGADSDTASEFAPED